MCVCRYQFSEIKYRTTTRHRATIAFKRNITFKSSVKSIEEKSKTQTHVQLALVVFRSEDNFRLFFNSVRLK